MSLLLRLERALGRLLFGCRWLLAPIYVGLAVSLVLLLVKFGLKLADLVLTGLSAPVEGFIVAVLSLVDLSLVANLVLIVMFAGYESFVSRLHQDDHPDRPNWMSHVGFGELKLKLMTSIVAISAIYLLEDFMNASTLQDRDLAWRAGLHIVFVVSAVLLAVMDRITRRAADH